MYTSWDGCQITLRSYGTGNITLSGPLRIKARLLCRNLARRVKVTCWSVGYLFHSIMPAEPPRHQSLLRTTPRLLARLKRMAVSMSTASRAISTNRQLEESQAARPGIPNNPRNRGITMKRTAFSRMQHISDNKKLNSLGVADVSWAPA